jgi:hypothetical protein
MHGSALFISENAMTYTNSQTGLDGQWVDT